MTAPVAEDFREALHAEWRAAMRAGAGYIDIASGELHRRVGGYPGNDHRMPTCCRVMRDELRAGDEIRAEPRGGKGASLTIRFQLPR